MASRAELERLLPLVDIYMKEAIIEELAGPLVGDRALFIGVTQDREGEITKVYTPWDGGTLYAHMRTDDGILDVYAPVEDWHRSVDETFGTVGMWVVRWTVATTVRNYI